MERTYLSYEEAMEILKKDLMKLGYEGSELETLLKAFEAFISKHLFDLE